MRVLRDSARLACSSFRRLLGVVRANRGLRIFCMLLLAIDVFWIVLFLVVETLWDMGIDDLLLSDRREFSLTSDHSIPEWFNYAQTSLVVVLLAWLARSTREWVYAAFTLVFAVVLLDDSLEIHESVGKYFVRLLDIRPILGLYPKDVGEVIAWAIIGSLVAPLVVWALARSSRAHRGNGLALLLSFGVLLICAVGVDQLYSNFRYSFFGSGNLLDIAEDGGEMIAITTACALTLAVVREVAIGTSPADS